MHKCRQRYRPERRLVGNPEPKAVGYFFPGFSTSFNRRRSASLIEKMHRDLEKKSRDRDDPVCEHPMCESQDVRMDFYMHICPWRFAYKARCLGPHSTYRICCEVIKNAMDRHNHRLHQPERDENGEIIPDIEHTCLDAATGRRPLRADGNMVCDMSCEACKSHHNKHHFEGAQTMTATCLFSGCDYDTPVHNVYGYTWWFKGFFQPSFFNAIKARMEYQDKIPFGDYRYLLDDVIIVSIKLNKI